MISIQFILILVGVLVSVIVILISYGEIQKCRKKCKIKVKLPNRWIKISSGNGIKHPMYVYNSAKIKGSELVEMYGLGDDYVKGKLDEHVISKISRNWKNAVRHLKYACKSRVPMHNLYKSVNLSGKAYGAINPLNDKENKYKIMLHRDDTNLDVFIADGEVIVV